MLGLSKPKTPSSFAAVTAASSIGPVKVGERLVPKIGLIVPMTLLMPSAR